MSWNRPRLKPAARCQSANAPAPRHHRLGRHQAALIEVYGAPSALILPPRGLLSHPLLVPWCVFWWQDLLNRASPFFVFAQVQVGNGGDGTARAGACAPRVCRQPCGGASGALAAHWGGSEACVRPAWARWRRRSAGWLPTPFPFRPHPVSWTPPLPCSFRPPLLGDVA